MEGKPTPKPGEWCMAGTPQERDIMGQERRRLVLRVFETTTTTKKRDVTEEREGNFNIDFLREGALKTSRLQKGTD